MQEQPPPPAPTMYLKQEGRDFEELSLYGLNSQF